MMLAFTACRMRSARIFLSHQAFLQQHGLDDGRSCESLFLRLLAVLSVGFVF